MPGSKESSPESFWDPCLVEKKGLLFALFKENYIREPTPQNKGMRA